jgi:hypothetical protein
MHYNYYEIFVVDSRDNNYCHYYVILRKAGFAITTLDYHPVDKSIRVSLHHHCWSVLLQPSNNK